MQVQLPASGWQPREYQIEAWKAMEAGCKRGCLVWHRRAGKDNFAINRIAVEAFKRVGAYWHVFPTYNQGRKIVWEGRMRDGKPFLSAFPEELVTRTRDDLMTKWFVNGSSYSVIGAENVDLLVGTNPVGVVMSEYAIQDPRMWNFLRPILAENDGWALFVYTPRGRNHGWKLWQTAQEQERWFAQKLTVDDTSFVDEDGTRRRSVPKQAIDDEREEGMPEELIQQEFYCSFDAPLVGSYFGDLITQLETGETPQITRVPWEPKLEVQTWWDLGVSDHTVIWFAQQAGLETRLIDLMWDTGKGFESYAKRLAEKPYTYGRHVAPHDIRVKEFGSGVTRLETAQSLGIRFHTAPKLPLAEGIQAVRSLLPRCWIDADRCEVGLQGLREYTKKRIEGQYGPKGEPLFSDEPEHTWASHFADALRTGAVADRGTHRGRKPPPPMRPVLPIV